MRAVLSVPTPSPPSQNSPSGLEGGGGRKKTKPPESVRRHFPPPCMEQESGAGEEHCWGGGWCCAGSPLLATTGQESQPHHCRSQPFFPAAFLGCGNLPKCPSPAAPAHWWKGQSGLLCGGSTGALCWTRRLSCHGLAACFGRNPPQFPPSDVRSLTMHGGWGGGLPPVCCWMGMCASTGGGTIGKWLQASDFKCQPALQLGELGWVVEPSARSTQEPTANTTKLHRRVPQAR